jgi:hypothetical protein
MSILLAWPTPQKREQAKSVVDPEGLAPSMQRLADVVSEHQAQVWFSHDLVQTNELRSVSPFE